MSLCMSLVVFFLPLFIFCHSSWQCWLRGSSPQRQQCCSDSWWPSLSKCLRMEVNVRSFLCNSPSILLHTISLIFYKDFPKCLFYPSARGSGMDYVGSLTYSDSKLGINREDMAGRNKAPNPNYSKDTWHHRGVIMKGKESEMSKS